LGLGSQQYLATWYMSNPFELLPSDLQEAIRQTPIPFKTRDGINAWCDEMGAPDTWRAALAAALIETTPFNLWRASRGERPYARNGETLEPIVIEHGAGRFEVREGHIAVDPRFIPINSEVLLLVRIQGEEHLLKVKAADTGSAIKGHHVDLPIYLHPNKEPLPRTSFPKEHIRNPYVRILMPIPAVSREPRVSRDRKA
jgi:3D (Asp-Asp-Asp) domain-containing protein